MNRRILIISYFFPPLGLAGVTRPLELFKRLTKYGYECHVLTVKPVAYMAHEPELLDGLDDSRIHRAGSYDPQRIMYLCGIRSMSSRSHSAGRSIASNMFPDAKRGWIGPAVRLGVKVVREKNIDIILSTSPPISSHVAAMKISERTGVKWAADFRDLWTTYPIEESYSSRSLVQRGEQLLAGIRVSAAAMSAVNRSVAEYVGTKEVITNGFAPENAARWSARSDAESFVIGLLGTYNESLPVEPLLKCLQKIRATKPSDFSKIRLLQVGRVDESWLLSQLQRYDMIEICEMRGLQSRTQSIEILNRVSMFYLGVAPGWGDRITTARIFDMMVSGRPILAYTRTDSEIAVLLKQTPNSAAFSDDNCESAVTFLTNQISRHKNDQFVFTPSPEYARQYSWDNIAGKFASLFDRAL